jgi:hypothetical protein
VEDATRPQRLLRTTTAILVPGLLYLRIAKRHAGRTPGRLAKATPALLLLLAAWSLGECVGYFTGEP